MFFCKKIPKYGVNSCMHTYITFKIQMIQNPRLVKDTVHFIPLPSPPPPLPLHQVLVIMSHHVMR